MNAYKYLSQYHSLMVRLNDLKDKLDMLEAEVDAIRSSSNNDGLPRSTKISSKVEDLAIELADRTMELTEIQLEAYIKLTEIYKTVLKVKNQSAQDVLRLYFIDLHSMPEVADILHYSERQVYRLRDKGVEEVQKLI